MGKKVGPYLVQHKIASGRFGCVYQACNTSVPLTQTGSLVALKAVPHRGVSAGVMKRVEFEVKSAQRLTSPYILRIFDIYKTARFVYFAMELCPGGDLLSKLKERGLVEERIARKLFREILEGFTQIQEKSTPNREVSLSHFLLTDPNIDQAHIKIMNFSLFRSVYFNSISQTVGGSAIYLAPEVFSCEEFTLKADSWTIGAVFFHIVTGIPPFQSETIAELRQEQREPLQFPEEVPLSHELKSLIFDLLRYSPDARPRLAAITSLPVVDRSVDAVSEESSPCVAGEFEVIEIEESYPDLALQYMEIPAVEDISPGFTAVSGADSSAAGGMELESELLQSRKMVSYAEMMEKQGKFALAIAIYEMFDEVLMRIRKEAEQIAYSSSILSQEVAELSSKVHEKLSKLRETMINSSMTDTQSLLLLESTLLPTTEATILNESQRQLRLASESQAENQKLSHIRLSLLLTSIVFQRFPGNSESEKLMNQGSEALGRTLNVA